MAWIRMGGGQTKPRKYVAFDGTYKNPDLAFSWDVPSGSVAIDPSYSSSAYTIRSTNWSTYPTAICTTNIDLGEYNTIRVATNTNNANYNVEIGYRDNSNTWHQIKYLQKGAEEIIDVSNIDGKLAFKQIYFAFWIPVLELTK